MPLNASYGIMSLRAFGRRQRNFLPLSAVAAPNAVSGSGVPTTETSGASTVTPSGGSGSFTYLWQYVSGDASIGPSPGTGAAAVATFTCAGLAFGETRNAVWRCRVTDTITGLQVFTNNVSVALSKNAALLPVWNVASGTNLGTWANGGAFSFVSLYATTPSGNVVFSSSGGNPVIGLSPGWTDNVSYSNATAATFQFGGQVTGGTPAGDYNFSFFALNPTDGSSQIVSIVVTVI